MGAYFLVLVLALTLFLKREFVQKPTAPVSAHPLADFSI